MAIGERDADPQLVRMSLLTPRRIALGAIAIVAILLSPLLVVYEFVVGLALVVGGFIARLIQRSPTERNVRAAGVALLAGPVAYALAAIPAQLFNW
jgi:chromate transport protein ChrA